MTYFMFKISANGRWRITRLTTKHIHKILKKPDWVFFQIQLISRCWNQVGRRIQFLVSYYYWLWTDISEIGKQCFQWKQHYWCVWGVKQLRWSSWLYGWRTVMQMVQEYMVLSIISKKQIALCTNCASKMPIESSSTNVQGNKLRQQFVP